MHLSKPIVDEQESSRAKKARSTKKRKSRRSSQLDKARAVKHAKNDVEVVILGHQQQLVEEPEEEDASSLIEQLDAVDDAVDGAVDDDPIPMQSRSALKLMPALDNSSLEESTGELEGFNLVDFELLANAISQAAVCKQCRKGSLVLRKNEKLGLALKLDLVCEDADCQSRKTFYTSKRCRSDAKQGPKQGGTPFEINQRMALAMRLLGRGLDGLRLFAGVMNMATPSDQRPFTNLMEKLSDAVVSVAEESMNNAASDVREKSESSDDIVDTKCLFDGTWQKRGFSSLIGVVSCISAVNYKVLDIEDLTKHCRGCTEIKKMKLPQEKEDKLLVNHHCTKNHEGSSPAMEVTGVRRIFERSVEKRSIRITGYVGDGDTKTYDTISNEKPYGDDVIVQKYECVGHVQKRVGTNLRKLKTKTGNKKLNDGKTLGGRGRLTLKEIDKLQIYYGLAIRRNIGNLDAMKNGIDAILRHRLSTDQLPNHSLCPPGSDSWCKYQQDPENYQHVNPMPKAVAVYVKPIFDRLKDEKLLKRCLAGYNQNAAESFNNVLWHICPKTTFVGSVPLKVCTSLAVILYNDGYMKLDGVFEKLGITSGFNSMKEFRRRDRIRVYKCEYKSSEKQKKIRQSQRRRRLEEQDRNIEVEGILYEYGGF